MRDMVTLYIDLTGASQRNIDLDMPMGTENIDRSGALQEHNEPVSWLTAF